MRGYVPVAVLCLCVLAVSGVSVSRDGRAMRLRHGQATAKFDLGKMLSTIKAGPVDEMFQARPRKVVDAFSAALKKGESALEKVKNKVTGILKKDKTEADKAFEEAEKDADASGEPESKKDAVEGEKKSDSRDTKPNGTEEPKEGGDKEAKETKVVAEKQEPQKKPEKPATMEEQRAAAVEMLAESLNCTVHKDDLEWTLEDIKDKWETRKELHEQRCQEEQDEIAASYEATRAAAESTMHKNISRVVVAWKNKTDAAQAGMDAWRKAIDGRVAELEATIEKLEKERAALNDTLVTARRENSVAQEAKRDQTKVAQLAFHSRVAAKKAETDEAMFEDRALLNETVNAAQKILDDGTAVCQSTHDEVVSLINADPYYAVKPEVDALNACRRKISHSKARNEEGAVSLLEVGTGCAGELLALQAAARQHEVSTSFLQERKAGRKASILPQNFFAGAFSKVAQKAGKLRKNLANAAEAAVTKLSAKVQKDAEKDAKADAEAQNVVDQVKKDLAPTSNEPKDAVDSAKKLEDKYYGPTEDEEGNVLTIPTGKMEAKLQRKKDAAAETLGKCTGTLQVAFDEKKMAAKKHFEETTAPLRVALEEFTAKETAKRDDIIMRVRAAAMVTDESYRKANASLVANTVAIAGARASIVAQQEKKADEEPDEQAKVDTLHKAAAKAVKSVTAKSKAVYKAKVAPLPALQKNEQGEAKEECNSKRQDILRDGTLITALTKAAKREVKEQKRPAQAK